MLTLSAAISNRLQLQRAHVGVVLATGACLLVVFVLLLFRDPVVIGGDEGMEFMKALIHFRNPAAVPLMWNDQPFFYTACTSALFGVFGPSALVPRAVTLLLAGGLVISLTSLVPREAKPGAKWICIALFFTWQTICELSASAMCELPALALGTISVALFHSYARSKPWWRLVPVGVAFGLALHIKLTTALLIPAATALMFQEKNYRAFAIAATFAATTFVLGIILTPGWRWNEVVGTHLGAAAAVAHDPYFRLPLSDFVNNLGTVAAALVAVLYYGWKRKLGDLTFPLVFLVTIATVHAVHRPWWGYYHVHFAIPLAILGGLGISLLWSGCGTNPLAEVSLKREVCAIGLAGVVGLWCSFDLRFTLERFRLMRGVESVQRNGLLDRMASFSNQTQWVFAAGPAEVYAFHAGLLIPPELAVLSQKRQWTTGFMNEEILAILKQYQPEQLIITRELNYPGWREFLKTEYVPTYMNSSWYLYIHKRLNPQALPTGDALVKRFGL